MGSDPGNGTNPLPQTQERKFITVIPRQGPEISWPISVPPANPATTGCAESSPARVGRGFAEKAMGKRKPVCRWATRSVLLVEKHERPSAVYRELVRQQSGAPVVARSGADVAGESRRGERRLRHRMAIGVSVYSSRPKAGAGTPWRGLKPHGPRRLPGGAAAQKNQTGILGPE